MGLLAPAAQQAPALVGATAGRNGSVCAGAGAGSDCAGAGTGAVGC